MAYIAKKKKDALVQFRIDRRYLATGLRFLIEQKHPVKFMSDVVRVIYMKGVESLIKEEAVEFIETTEDANSYINHYLDVNLNPSGRGIGNLAKNFAEESGPTHLLPNATKKEEGDVEFAAKMKTKIDGMAEDLKQRKEGRVLTDTSPIVSTPEQVKKAKDLASGSGELEVESEEEFEDYENGQIEALSELDSIPSEVKRAEDEG